jgi:agmatinase
VFEQPIFETVCTRGNASIVVVPVCYDGTASYAKGTRNGPAAIMQAYEQLDYEDPRFPDVSDSFGVFVDKEVKFNAAENANSIGSMIRQQAKSRATAILQAGQTPVFLGGEHSISQGAVESCADFAGELGVLQIDAHMDLRHEYEGYAYSHASVMRNVLDSCPHVTRLLQVGIRDYCIEEKQVVERERGRVAVLRDDVFSARLDSGTSAKAQFEEAVALLPESIYITFDIDGLDPSLCPSTGTPVPGGLSFNQAALLLQVVVETGKKVIGFDLVEVAPSPLDNEWDANVGARVLNKLCRCADATKNR